DLEEGDQCGGGTLGTGDGEFSNGSGGNFVAVGPNETLYVGDAGRIQEFTLGGVFKGELKLQGELAGKTVRCLSVDAGGNLFLVLAGENQVRKLSSLGEVLAI